MSTTLLLLLVSGALAHYQPPSAEMMDHHSIKHSQHIRGPHHPRGSAPRAHHVHYTPQRNDESAPKKLTQDTQLLRDEEHIREDLGNVISKEDTKKMTTEELEFHYFKLHDFDNNTKLDGLEILQAIQHVVHDDHNDEDTGENIEAGTPKPPRDDFAYYVELIDKVLKEDDLDNDGYLSYIEYVLGRQKDDHEMQKHATITKTN